METRKPDEVGEVGEETVGALNRVFKENFRGRLASLSLATL